jgi:hypothetical protein
MQAWQQKTSKTLFSQNVWPGLLTAISSKTSCHSSLQIRIRLWLKHDCAPLHLLLAFRAFLNKVVTEQWIGTKWDNSMACSFI